ncbi:PadR family transcriptional regulator [Haloarchaeobius sp. TZWWS8]|uniref:PadR family transcriptional regulator n=1 Tax=Haloarchaeobius sp. TZWWS8 TaxID=3446121 RepID=UPI003EB8C422
MTKFLQSGRRRDLCFILADAGSLPAQKLKTRLERHYDERIEPKSFYGALESMVDAGLLVVRTEGLHDVYELSEAGDRMLQAHYEWVESRMR